MPGELQRIGEGLEVGDGPLVAIWASGADEIAQQVHVEADEDQERRVSRMRSGAAALYRRAEREVGQRGGNQVGGQGADKSKCQGV